jgi:hypothetical protein
MFPPVLTSGPQWEDEKPGREFLHVNDQSGPPDLVSSELFRPVCRTPVGYLPLPRGGLLPAEIPAVPDYPEYLNPLFSVHTSCHKPIKERGRTWIRNDP